mgnify:CR=1 FL=1
MNILIIAPIFPPDKGVGTVRFFSLAKHLLKCNTCFLITNEKENKVDIDFADVIYIKQDLKGTNFFATQKKFKNMGQKYCKAAIQLFTNKIDIVLITGGPFYTFSVAKVAKRYGIPCVLDFRDPWIFDYRENESFKQQILNKLVHFWDERQAIYCATKVVTVSSVWRKTFQKYYPLCKNKFYTIENGYDDERIENINFEYNSNEERLIIGVFGKMFYYSYKYAAVFLDGLKLFDKTNSMYYIKQIGEEEQVVTSLLKENQMPENLVMNTGFLEYEIGMQELNKTDAFLIIDSRKTAIGTKIYDYIFLNKPIIYVGPKDSLIGSEVGKFSNGFVCETSMEVAKAFRMLKKGECLDKNVLIKDYSRSDKNIKWSELINEIVTN